ncbi:transcription antitermination factor NusB [Deinococcus sonorensis]|uniref:Transcription antitermination protein NusB n=2 Tax=Deinococcus sonorensis TaxID=309891 RepID=A0AAU7U9V9_9DEIO
MTRRREKAAQPTGSRRAAREFAFRVLFEAQQGDLDLGLARSRAEGAMREGDELVPALSDEGLTFAGVLLDAMAKHGREVDDLLRRTIRGWSFEQMAQTDLNVMRLAVLEMVFLNEVHPPVIESAVRIARKYGGEDSGRFVNGVLAGFSRSQGGGRDA